MHTYTNVVNETSLMGSVKLTEGAATRYVVIEPMASYECHRTVTSGRAPRARSHTLRVDRASRSDTSNVKVVQIRHHSSAISRLGSSLARTAYETTVILF